MLPNRSEHVLADLGAVPTAGPGQETRIVIERLDPMGAIEFERVIPRW